MNLSETALQPLGLRTHVLAGIPQSLQQEGLYPAVAPDEPQTLDVFPLDQRGLR